MSKNKLKLSKKIIRLTSSRYRLSVKKSNLHIYAQIIDDKQNKTLISASSLKVDKKKGIRSSKACWCRASQKGC